MARLLKLRTGAARIEAEDIRIPIAPTGARLQPPRIHWGRLGIWW